MPKSRPPKNVPARVSSWAKPWTTSGGKSSERTSQTLDRSRQSPRLAIVRFGKARLGAPWPFVGTKRLKASENPSGGVASVKDAPRRSGVHVRPAEIQGSRAASIQSANRMVRSGLACAGIARVRA